MSNQIDKLTETDAKTQMGGHLLVECLVAQGVTHAFGVPGESYLAVLDGFHKYQDQIQLQPSWPMPKAV
ncbi:MAG: Acetolactate synthase isozyme 3 large subunit [Pseudomonadota bacterium]